MSDETPDPAEPTDPTVTPDVTTEPDPAGEPDAPSVRSTTPAVAAARRARQLGGQRRPLPRPTPDAEAADTPDRPAARRPSPTARPAAKSVAAKPATSVGRRPRPRPTVREEPAPVETAAAAPRPGPGRVLVGACLALTVALLAVGVLFLVRTVTASPQVSARETERVLAAAKTDVALFASYGYQTIDADAAKAAAVLTGQFKQDYLKSIAEVVKPQLPTSKTVDAGQVDTAGLVSVSSDGKQAVVVVYGQSSITNVSQKTPRIDAFQLQVTMQRVDGQWLVAQLKQLGNNA